MVTMLHAGGPEILQRLDDLVPLLAQPHHQSGFRRDAGGDLARSPEHLERARIASARTRGAIQARHRLDVVVEHVGPRVEDDAQRRLVPLEIRDQHLEAAGGDPRPRLGDRPGEVRRAEVRQVVAIDGGDDDVAELEGVDGAGDLDRLLLVGRRAACRA